MTPQDDDTPGPTAAAGPADDGGAGGVGGAADDSGAGNAADDSGSAGARDASADSASAADAGGSELRITVARTGGIAGLGPQWTVTASEEEEDVDSWLSLVESCPWDAPDPADAPGASGAPAEAANGAGNGPIGGSADRFVYTIRVFLPSEEERDARVPEQRLDGPWRDLVDRVKDAGRPEPRADR
jgi:hypothetical protein